MSAGLKSLFKRKLNYKLIITTRLIDWGYKKLDLQTKKLAVLIDADNSSVSSIGLILEEIAKYGIASVKRVYGDWSSESLNKWRDILLPHAITPVQQFAYTTGKDATDMGLIIDAMDLLYSGALDGFCIISSDSDFTPLASRIRESGLVVVWCRT